MASKPNNTSAATATGFRRTAAALPRQSPLSSHRMAIRPISILSSATETGIENPSAITPHWPAVVARDVVDKSRIDSSGMGQAGASLAPAQLAAARAADAAGMGSRYSGSQW